MFHNVLRGIAVTTCAGRTTLIDLGDFPSPFVFPIIGLQGGFEPPGVVYFIRRHTIAGTFAAFNTKTKNNDYEYSITADSWPEGEESNLPVAPGFSDARLLMHYQRILCGTPYPHLPPLVPEGLSRCTLGISPRLPARGTHKQIEYEEYFERPCPHGFVRPVVCFSVKGRPAIRQKQKNMNLEASQCLPSMRRTAMPIMITSHPKSLFSFILRQF